MYLFTAGLPKRPTLFQIITNQLNKHRSKQWLLSLAYRLVSICSPPFSPVGEPCVLRAQHQYPTATSRRKNPQHVFPVAFFLPISHRLLPQSRGSLKVNPPQQLSLLMLVRKSALKEKTASSLPKNKKNNQPTKGRTDGRRGCSVSLSLSLSLAYFLSALRFPGAFM